LSRKGRVISVDKILTKNETTTNNLSNIKVYVNCAKKYMNKTRFYVESAGINSMLNYVESYLEPIRIIY
jgi:hypothetical protein